MCECNIDMPCSSITMFQGDPMGGHINNYLLEKSRVIAQQGSSLHFISYSEFARMLLQFDSCPQAGENNFHAFYQLLKGAPAKQLDKMHLKNDLSLYRYLGGGGGGKTQLPQKVR